MGDMEPKVLRVTERDAVRDMAAILKQVERGTEVVVERDAHPVAVIRPAVSVRRTLAECIALATAHENETGQSPALDPDFAADVEEIIRNRKSWNPPTWD